MYLPNNNKMLKVLFEHTPIGFKNKEKAKTILEKVEGLGYVLSTNSGNGKIKTHKGMINKVGYKLKRHPKIKSKELWDKESNGVKRFYWREN